jgi:hypothetical protein
MKRPWKDQSGSTLACLLLVVVEEADYRPA